MLPQELKARAVRQASDQGLSLGELIRRSLERSLSRPSTIAEDPVFSDGATYAGEVPTSYVADHDEHLYGPRS